MCRRAALRLDGIAGIVLFLVSLILLETDPDSGLVVVTLICAFNVSSSVLIPNLSFVWLIHYDYENILLQIKEALHSYPQAVSDINVDMLSMQNLCEFAEVEKEVQDNIILAYLNTSLCDCRLTSLHI